MMVKLMVRQGLIGMIMPIFYNLDLSNFEPCLVERLKNVNQLKITVMKKSRSLITGAGTRNIGFSTFFSHNASAFLS